jgi:autotransporter-associated beta strand protein
MPFDRCMVGARRCAKPFLVSFRALLARTTLSHITLGAIGFAFTALAFAPPAFAQAVGGDGGTSLGGLGVPGGQGGTGVSPNGANGTGSPAGGGGGGGGGVSTVTGSGGTGGTGGDAGGNSSLASIGGNGGNGGAYNQVNPAIIATGTGTIGIGGTSSPTTLQYGGGGGGGGAGGGGVLSTTGGTLTIIGGTSIAGGNGGSGGHGGNVTQIGPAGGNGGNGGGGGDGIVFTAGGTLTNNGSITGGKGGTGGAGGTSPDFHPGGAGNPGAGGSGIVGSNVTIINNGTILGGLFGDNVTRANAITFTGGSNFLNLNSTGTQGTLTGNIGVAGTLTFNQTNAVTLGASNLITGAGAIIQAGPGMLTLNGANTFSGGTTSSAGTLVIGDSAALGSGAVTFNGGTLQAGSNFLFVNNAILLGAGGGTIVSDGRRLVFLGNITDGTTPSGPLVLTNAGAVADTEFFGNNTYSGATIINASATLFAESATALSPNSNFTVNGQLILDGVNGTVRSLSGNGSVSTFAFDGAATLTIALPTGSATFGGVLSDGDAADPLSLVKTGAGTQVLTGINTYTGTTTVNGGTLEVDGSIASTSTVTVNSGGTLSGVGTIDLPVAGGPVTINAGGTFAPGNGTAGSSMTISGNLAFQSGAMYLVQINPSTASFANVTGTATLGGATVNAMFTNGSYVAKQYTILSAASVSGTFSPDVVNTNLPSGFKTSLSYDPAHAFLDLQLAFVAPPGSGLSGNQQGVGNALTNFFNTNGSIPLVFGSLTPAGLTQISGETAVGSQQTTFNAMSQFINLLTDPFMGRGDGINGATSAPGYAEEEDGEASAYAARKRLAAERETYAMFTKAPLAKVYEPRWSVWTSGFGGSQSTNGNAVVGSNDTSSSIFGTAVGADYLFSPDTLAGFALAGGGTNFSVNNLGSGRSDLFQAGAYVRHTQGAAYITGALAYGWQDITTNRTVTIAGLDQLRAEFNANAYSGRLEGGYRFVAPWVGGIGITPYAAGQFTTFDLPAYAESVVSGAANFALAYSAKSVTDSRSELGLRTDKSFAVINGVLTLRGRFAWAHDFNPDRSIAATFQALPGASFVVGGAAQASDSALTSVSAEMKWINGWSAAATFEGEFSNVTRSYAGKGTVRYIW